MSVVTVVVAYVAGLLVGDKLESGAKKRCRSACCVPGTAAYTRARRMPGDPEESDVPFTPERPFQSP